ncbi:hypothetical protein J6590_045380, partial [Homalodisca vitripennis]
STYVINTRFNYTDRKANRSFKLVMQYCLDVNTTTFHSKHLLEQFYIILLPLVSALVSVGVRACEVTTWPFGRALDVRFTTRWMDRPGPTIAWSQRSPDVTPQKRYVTLTILYLEGDRRIPIGYLQGYN